ncbi:MAG: type II toxin-antitoxin system HicB family antitoxin [Candidatus Goldiibacteriota bacterium]
MKDISYVAWKEGRYFVAQCLNIDVSSFGKTMEEASKNIREAVELYLETKGSINCGVRA